MTGSRSVSRWAGPTLGLVLRTVSIGSAAEPAPFQETVEDILSQDPRQQADRDPCELPGETRVYKLAPTEQLERLMQLLLEDPFMMPLDENSVSIVVVARPLPCGERLRSARVELWDSFALERRGGLTRWLHRAGDWFRRRDPSLWEIVFPDGGVTEKARKGYRLTRVLKFRRGSPGLSTINGFGVVVFPVAANSIAGATLTFQTEKRTGKRGKKRERRRRVGGPVALPGPHSPVDDPRTIRSRLGIGR